jgi:hypothetical protein
MLASGISHLHLSVPNISIDQIVEDLLFVSGQQLEFCKSLQVLTVQLFG